MSSRGRVKQLEKIHAEISGGGSCFTTRALKKCIGQEVNTDMLPSSVYFSDFLDAFQGEITRLQDQEEYLKYQINQYKVKKRMHLAKYDEELATASINEKIMKDSKLSLIIEEARELPAMNTNNTADPFFTVKCDDKVVFQSPMISDTADPIWNSRFVIPILNKSHNIEVEVWDDEVTPEFIGSFVLDLDTYEDQQVHCRWYDLEGPEGISNGEVKVLGQWLYNLLTFHQMFIDKYEHLITINEKSLLLITQQINKLYSLDGIELLQAWLSPPPPPTISKNRRSQHFLSIPPSKNNSVIGSPKNSPKSRYVKPAAFSNFLAAKEFDKIRYESPLGYSSARPTHYSLDYFAIGMFVSNRIKLKKPRGKDRSTIYAQNHGSPLYNGMQQPRNGKLLTKLKPTVIMLDKEKLYEDNLQLKLLVNYYKLENNKLTTKIRQQDKELNQKDDIIQEITSNNENPTHKNLNLLSKLSETLREKSKMIKNYQKDLEKFKTENKMAKTQELEKELSETKNQYVSVQSKLDEISREKLKIQNDLKNTQKLLRDYSTTLKQKEAEENKKKFNNTGLEEQKQKALNDLAMLQKKIDEKETALNQIIQELNKRIEDQNHEHKNKMLQAQQELNDKAESFVAKENALNTVIQELRKSLENKENEYKLSSQLEDKEQEYKAKFEKELIEKTEAFAIKEADLNRVIEELNKKIHDKDNEYKNNSAKTQQEFNEKSEAFLAKESSLKQEIQRLNEIIEKKNKELNEKTLTVPKELTEKKENPIKQDFSLDNIIQGLKKKLEITENEKKKMALKFGKFITDKIQVDSDKAIEEYKKKTASSLLISYMPSIQLTKTSHKLSEREKDSIKLNVSLSLQLSKVSRSGLAKVLFGSDLPLYKYISRSAVASNFKNPPFLFMNKDPSIAEKLLNYIFQSSVEVKVFHFIHGFETVVPDWKVFTVEEDKKAYRELSKIISTKYSEIQNACEVYDKTATGIISSEEFQIALKKCGIQLSETLESYLASLCYSFSYEIDKIEYNKLITTFTKSFENLTKDDKDYICDFYFNKISKSLRSANDTIENKFKINNETIAKEDFVSGLNSLNINLENSLIEIILESFDHKSQGQYVIPSLKFQEKISKLV